MKFEELYQLIEMEEKKYKVFKTGVFLSNSDFKKLSKIPEIFKDSVIKGNFRVPRSIKNLKNSPKAITGYFSCSINSNLTSLEGGPSFVGGGYYCYDCNLKNLKGAPNHIRGRFQFSLNDKLESLDGFPKKVDKDVWVCTDNYTWNDLTHSQLEKYIREICQVGGIIRYDNIKDYL